MKRRLLGAALLFPFVLRGQMKATIPVAYELRADARFARENSIEAGGSVIVPAGSYVRTAVTALGGVAHRGNSTSEGRFEVTSRFLLDPFRESPLGLSLGGGVGATNSDGTWRPYLAVLADLELRRGPGLMPALQVGLGHGWRIGLSLRNSRGNWR